MLSELKGRKVILAFYPADWSPVCGDQMALYNEMLKYFRNANAELVGISVDSKWCYTAFAENRKLHFYDIKLPAGVSAASEVQRRLPGIRLVKAFNTLYYTLLLTNSHSNPLTTITVCSDDEEAKDVVKKLITEIGFQPFDLGGLNNVLLQEPDGPYYNKSITLDEAETIWNTNLAI